jgi:DNA-binding IclR family transcriptional regulator
MDPGPSASSDRIGPDVTGSGARTAGPVERSFQLLQLVVAAETPIGVRELSRRSGLSKSAVGRLLGVLDGLGMIERTPTGAARPGAALATLTRRVDRTPAWLREQLRPLTVDLEREFGENAAVGVDSPTGLLYLASTRTAAAVQVADPAGESYPHHLVAPGLVAMSAWSPSRLDRYLSTPLASATVHSVTDPAAVRDRLAGIGRDGFAWTDQELDLDVNGLAVPIVDADGRQIAVATLYGPAYRLGATAQPDLGRRLADFVADRAPGLIGA